MGELKKFPVVTGHPDIAGFELQSLSQLNQGSFEDGVTVECAPNLMRQHSHMLSCLFLLLHRSHLLI